MGESLFGIEKPKPAPIIPPAAPPPTINEAQERQVAGDRARFRRGAAANRLSAPSAPAGRVGVFKALGGGSSV